MTSLPRRLGRIAALLALLAGGAIAATGWMRGEPLMLVGAVAVAAFAGATWRAFNLAPRPPAGFAWAGVIGFGAAALAARDWLAVPLALAAAAYLAAAVASSAWRFRTRGTLT